MQFLLISKKEDILLAEGRFPIIGLALATPEVAPSTTSETPSTLLPRDDLFTITPTPVEAPPFSTPVGTTTDGPPPSTGGPPGS